MTWTGCGTRGPSGTKFYPHQWPVVLRLYEHFGRQHGIWMLDLHPGNIRFLDSSLYASSPES